MNNIDEFLSTASNIKNYNNTGHFEKKSYQNPKLTTSTFTSEKDSLELTLNKYTFINQAKNIKLKQLQDLINEISNSDTDKIQEDINIIEGNREKILLMVNEYEKKIEEEIDNQNQLKYMLNQENIRIVINIKRKIKEKSQETKRNLDILIKESLNLHKYIINSQGLLNTALLDLQNYSKTRNEKFFELKAKLKGKRK